MAYSSSLAAAALLRRAARTTLSAPHLSAAPHAAASHHHRRPPQPLHTASVRPLTSSSSSSSSARAEPAAHDYYGLLRVPRTASPADIKKAYYALAKNHHPDRAGGDPALFARVSTAYEALSDPAKRRIYDHHGEEGLRAAAAGADPSATGSPFGFGGQAGGGATAADVEELLKNFGDFFSGAGGPGAGGGGPGGSTRRPRADAPAPGADRQAGATLSLRDAAFGVARTLRVAAREACTSCDATGKTDRTSVDTCPACNGEGRVSAAAGMFGAVVMECGRCGGTGGMLRDPCARCDGRGVVAGTKEVSVQFPPGCDSGMVLRVPGAGDAGLRGGPAGDLFIQVTVEEDAYFHRRGRDLHVVAPISLAQAALGGDVTVRTLEGEERVPVRSGTQPDDTLTLSGRALRGVNGPKRGDQVVHFKVVVPDNVSGRQKELLEELLELEGGKLTRPEDCSSTGLLQRFQRFLRRNVKG